MRLIVSPLPQVEQLLAEHRPSHLVTLASPGAEAAFDAEHRLDLRFNDIAAPREGLVAPSAEHVEALIAFAQGWTGARPLLIHCWAGVSRSTAAAYVVACDGGSSMVRTQLDMPLEDLDFDEPWLVVDVLMNERGLAKLPQVSVQYCEPERPCTLVIGPKNHRRWEISLKPGEDPKLAATPEATWQLLSRWITPQDGTLWRQSSYRFHALVAQHWRQGRVFLAGDAAHMQPPFLGQGMCQGVRDVSNLAWKLIAVLRGEVGGASAEALLDSYGTERKAHVRELTSRIKQVGAVICERDPVKARARDAALLAQCGGTVKDTPRQDILPRLETGLLAQQDHAARGSLFPQPWFATGEGAQRMDAVAGNGWRCVLAPSLADMLGLVSKRLKIRCSLPPRSSPALLLFCTACLKASSLLNRPVSSANRQNKSRTNRVCRSWPRYPVCLTASCRLPRRLAASMLAAACRCW